MKIISFYSDKGGSGATMLNVAVGAYLTYKNDKKVCIVDTVAGGFRSLSDDRIEEINQIVENKSNYNDLDISPEELESLKKSPLEGGSLPIFKIEDFKNFLEFLKDNKNKFDFILLDVSGVSLPNYNFLMKSHFIFLLSTLNEINQDKKTYNAFERLKIKKTKHLFNLNDVYLLFNKVEKKRDYEDLLKKIREKNDINLLKSIIYNRVTFNDYSTITGFFNKSSEVEMVTQEIYELIQTK